MANAAKDNNNVNTMTAVSNADGSTIMTVRADPSTHALDECDGSTGSDLTGDNALRDNNYVTTLIAVSSVDGVTPVPLYIDSASCGLLTKST